MNGLCDTARVAIYHLSIQVIRRKERRNAVACAAYRAGACLQLARTGVWFDHSHRIGIQSALVLPLGVQLPRARGVFCPHELRGRLWNAAEDAETRVNSVVARELNVALPRELDDATGWDLAMTLGRYLADRYGVAADVAMHPPSLTGDDRNCHAHIMWTTRTVDTAGGDFAFGAKTRVLDAKKVGPQEIVAIRHAWADMANGALAHAGVVDDLGQPVRISARSLVDQGIDREPTEHDGPMITNRRRAHQRAAVQAAPVTPAPVPAAPAMPPVDLSAIWPRIPDLPEAPDPAAVARAWGATVPAARPGPLWTPMSAPATILVEERELVGRADPLQAASRSRTRTAPSNEPVAAGAGAMPSTATSVNVTSVQHAPRGGPAAAAGDKDVAPSRRRVTVSPPTQEHLPPPSRSPKKRRKVQPLSPLQPVDAEPPDDASADVERPPEEVELTIRAVRVRHTRHAVPPPSRNMARAIARAQGKGKGKGLGLSQAKASGKKRARGKGRPGRGSSGRGR